MLTPEVILIADCSQWWIAELGLFPLIPNYTFMLLLIQFLFELKENTSPEQLNCLFCYNKLCICLHRKQKLDLHGISNTVNIDCYVRLIYFLCLCTQSPSKPFKCHAAKKKINFSLPFLFWLGFILFFFPPKKRQFLIGLSQHVFFFSISLQPCKRLPCEKLP